MVFSSLWKRRPEGEGIPMAAVMKMEVVPMPQMGMVAVLLLTADGPEHAARIESGTEAPSRAQVVMRSAAARELSLALARSAAEADGSN